MSARVVLNNQVWVIRPEYAERLAVHPTAQGDELWPIRADRYDTTAARPSWPDGIPHPCCTRWATVTDVLVGQWRAEGGGLW